MGLKWYVIRTEPRGEYRAYDELGRGGFEVYFPRAKAPQMRTSNEDLPLFPGYLFLKCDASDEGMPTLSLAFHVLGWLSFGGVVPSLPDEFVDQLRSQLEDINQEGGLWRRFHSGEKVRVVSGNLETLAEVVEGSKSPRTRVKVLMEFMGQLVPTYVPVENIQSAESEPAERRQQTRRTRGKSRWIGAQASAKL